MQNLNIAIAGLGVVGSGVYDILQRKQKYLQAKTGCLINVNAVSSKNKDKKRKISLNKNIKWYENPIDLTQLKDVDLVVELIGGSDGVALELAKKSLHNKKHFVTANKALLAKHWNELHNLAKENNVILMYEASVAGGIPLIKHIKEGLVANKFLKICGILNGTCNYILSNMSLNQISFEDALKLAQEKGYAETPPDIDIKGFDSAHKLCIIANLAYGIKTNSEEFYIEGIDKITLEDINYAKNLGYSIKLLGIASQNNQNEIGLKVHPALIENNSDLAKVDGVYNAVSITTDEAGKSFISGEGAGMLATASAVVSDIVDVINKKETAFYSSANAVKYLSIENEVTSFYLRFSVYDKLGILSKITNILSEGGVSIDNVLQKHRANNITDIIIITYDAKENLMQSLFQKIIKANENEDFFEKPPILIRKI